MREKTGLTKNGGALVAASIYLLVILILLTAGHLAGHVSADEIRSATQAVKRMKAVQILILPVDNVDQIRLLVRGYRDAGFDTIILRAFQLPRDRLHGPVSKVAEDTVTGVYFPTTRAPVITDLITPFVKACREEGVRPFAWMVTRDARFGNGSLPPEIAFHPDSGTLNPTPRLDVFHPAAQGYLEGLFTDLARTGVDGILLQDDLSSRMVEGFTEGNMDRYRTVSRDVVPPFLYLEQVTADDGRSYLKTKPGFDRWIAWKTKGLISLARTLQDSAARVSPGISLVMNQMYETVTDPDNGRLWLSQDLASSLSQGPPYAAIMLYHRQMQKELDLDASGTRLLINNSLADLKEDIEHRSRVVLKFQTQDWDTGSTVPGADLVRTLNTAAQGGWSLALVPPPTEEQLRVLSPILRSTRPEALVPNPEARVSKCLRD